MFVITIDTDWAPQSMIDDTVKILNEHKIPSTFFITNEINFDSLKNHELAIHPHFTSSNHEEILSKNLQILPSKKSKGSRSHLLYHSSSLMMGYEKFGIQYDSNYFLPSYEKVEPFFLQWANVLEIPFFFADDAHYEVNNHFDINKINLVDLGVKVFLFHPFHIFMNTSSLSDYTKFKEHYHDLPFLQQYRNLNKKGIRNLFLDLLAYIKSNKIEIKTMDEVNMYYRQNKNENIP